MKNKKLLRTLLPVTALVFGAPFTTTLLRAESVASVAADVKGDIAKAQLKDLDAQIDRLDELKDNAPTREERDAAQIRIDGLKARRSELRKNYVQARYDELKADVKNETSKLSAWTKKTFSRAESSAERKLDAAGDKMKDAAKDTADAAREARADVSATVNPASLGASADVAAYKTNPTEENKAEVKAALASLDVEIKSLEDRADALPKGAERDATKLRIKALKDRRGELASDFRKARFDALKADVKSEWNRIVH